MSTEYRGSCLCGAVHWEIRGPIARTSRCWCTMCQKQHGAAYAPYANAARADFVITQGEDALAHYASSPGVDRSFCKVCGSNIGWTTTEAADRIAVAMGTFDTPYEGLVTRDLHLDTKPAWIP
ncbi:GFA family protein [Zemynaea arenosa]|nr:GFA family protein [Massilia arenosa]